MDPVLCKLCCKTVLSNICVAFNEIFVSFSETVPQSKTILLAETALRLQKGQSYNTGSIVFYAN